jgi:hypothetical protein
MNRTGRGILTFITAALLLAGWACGTDDGGGDTGTDWRTDNPADWTTDTPVDVPNPDVTPDGPPPDGTDGCDERATWIYLVDNANNLLVFKPADLSLSVLGVLDCPAPMLYNPFSMAVDRTATAWVLFANISGLGLNGGQLFKVSTTVNPTCEATGFTPSQGGLDVFGMGFVSNSPGSEDETLYVAGGAILSIGSGTATLAWIDTSTLVLQTLGQVPQWPELTGTGLAELWGYFPESDPPTVQKIDKASGTTSNPYPIPALDTGQTLAWAFAFWGGDFYIFHMSEADASTNIWLLDTETSSASIVVPNTGYEIVGAGVSTCAPVGPI